MNETSSSERQARIATALMVFRHGGLAPERLASAIAATAQQAGLTEEIVLDRWRAAEAYIRFSVAHGTLKPDPSPEAG